MCIAVPKLLWKLNIWLDHAYVSFSDPYDFGVLIKVLSGNDFSYHSQIMPKFLAELTGGGIRVGAYFMTYAAVLFLLLTCSFSVTMYMQKSPSTYRKTASKPTCAYFVILAVMLLVYLFGLIVTYMFKFSEYEALRLASMSRYVGIPVACLWLTFVLGYLCSASDIQASVLHFVIFSAFVIACSDASALQKYFSKQNVYISYITRWEYDSSSRNIKNAIGERDTKIYLIVQESSGYEKLVMRYELRPYEINEGSTWSIGEKPFYDGDDYTQIITPEDWEAEVLDGYDYVYLFYVNDYFRKTYSDFFCGDIEEQALYAVDRSAGVCHIVECSQGSELSAP